MANHYFRTYARQDILNHVAPAEGNWHGQGMGEYEDARRGVLLAWLCAEMGEDSVSVCNAAVEIEYGGFASVFDTDLDFHSWDNVPIRRPSKAEWFLRINLERAVEYVFLMKGYGVPTVTPDHVVAAIPQA